MEDLIMPCGDNCSFYPRHTAQTEEELQRAADLWYKAGWSKTVMYLDKVKCRGCESHTHCGYGIKKYLKRRDIKKCNQCLEYPCEIIDAMLKSSQVEQKKCKEMFSDAEYAILHKAFFEKVANLKK